MANQCDKLLFHAIDVNSYLYLFYTSMYDAFKSQGLREENFFVTVLDLTFRNSNKLSLRLEREILCMKKLEDFSLRSIFKSMHYIRLLI